MSLATVAKLPAGDSWAYYSAEGPGVFMGAASRHLGVEGERVGHEQSLNLDRGLSPDGRRKLGWTRRFGGWDVVVLWPKSMSIHEVSHPESGRDFEAADRQATAALIAFLEGKCAWGRRGAQGKRLEKGKGLLFEVWTHWISRAGQPARHTHHKLRNLLLRADGSWGSIAGIRSTRAARNKNAKHGSAHRSPIYEAKMEAGELYRTVLRSELEARGYRTRDREKFGFELEGVSDRLIQHFSRRRREVLVKAEEIRADRERKGEWIPEDQKLNQWAATSSRAEKPAHIDLEQLRRTWREEAQRFQDLSVEAEHPLGRRLER